MSWGRMPSPVERTPHRTLEAIDAGIKKFVGEILELLSEAVASRQSN